MTYSSHRSFYFRIFLGLFLLIITTVLLGGCRVESSQVAEDQTTQSVALPRDFQNSLQEEALREVGFDKNNTEVHEETFIYLGYVISNNKKYHIGNFETIWGGSRRSTKRIIVFSEAGNYVGDYGLLNSFPTVIIDNRYLLFPEPTLGNPAGKKIDFSEGIPNTIFFDGENISFDKKYPALFL